MQYDPIKRSVGGFFNKTPFLRKVLYKFLDLLLLRAWHIKKELKLWSATAGDKMHILDAGAGFGQYTYRMNKMNKNWNILALDVKDEQVADCNQFFRKVGGDNVLFKVGDLTKFQEPEAFDMILCVDVMEHIEDDRTVFENYVASLKPGGILLISTPSDQGGSGLDHDEHTDGEVHGFVDEHARDGYNIEEIKEKILTAGFSKVEARYSYGKPGKISWKLSMFYPMSLLNVSKLFFIIIPFYFILTYPFAYILNWMDVKNDHESGTGLVVKAWK